MMRVCRMGLFLPWRALELVRRNYNSIGVGPAASSQPTTWAKALILAHKPSVSNRSVRRRSTAEAADGCHRPLLRPTERVYAAIMRVLLRALKKGPEGPFLR